MGKKPLYILICMTGIISFSLTSAKNQVNNPAGPSVKPAKGFQSEFIHELNIIEKKLIDLAGAIPQEKYKWRPGGGVRSVSEVFTHIALTNFMLPQFAGVVPPPDLDRNLEKNVTNKTQVLHILKKSFEHIRQAILQTPLAALDDTAKYFGENTTIRGVFFNAAMHMHEHLGQLIAYARINEIVPPWSAAAPNEQPQRNK